MKKTTIHLLIFLFALEIGSINASAQSKSSSGSDGKKLFTAWGFSPFLGAEQAPVTNVPIYVLTTNPFTYNSYYTPVTVKSAYFTYDIFTFIYRLRYNIAEMGNNQSISISVLPALGLGVSSASYVYSQGVGAGALSLNIPLILEFNTGNVSTYTSDQDKGWVFGLGIEYTKAPLFVTNGSDFINAAGGVGPVVTTSSWIEPVVEIGYRYWNKRNKAKEFNLKVGYGSGSAFSARLSWLKCIGY